MTRNIKDENLKNVTGGALDITQRRSADDRRRAKAAVSEGGDLPGGPGVELENEADGAPSSGPVDLGRRR